MVAALHAEVTFSHSPALVPIAVRYLVGTVTPMLSMYSWLRFLLRLKHKAGL